MGKKDEFIFVVYLKTEIKKKKEEKKIRGERDEDLLLEFPTLKVTSPARNF